MTNPDPAGRGPLEAQSPLLSAKERELGFEVLEVAHHHDMPDWEKTVRIELPRFDLPPKVPVAGALRDFHLVSVVKILGESDAIFRTESAGKRVYSHLRWGYGSCWSYATFGGYAAWHPVSDPYDSVEDAVACSTLTKENPGVMVMPAKFSSRPFLRP